MDILFHHLMKALGWSIFHSLWQGAAIYGFLFLLFLALPKRSARLKHNLSFGGLFLMLLAFGISFYRNFDLPLNNSEKVLLQQLTTHNPWTEQALLTPPSLIKAETWFPLICGLYLAGIAIQFVVLSIGYRRLRLYKTTGLQTVPTAWQEVFQDTLNQLNIGRRVHFFLSEKVNVPLVIGYFKPVILFPLALATQLDIRHVEAILIHELSHIRRNDYLFNLIKTTIETLLFFNPFMWLTSRFIQIEREHACDDIVVEHTDAPLQYAHALLQLELLKHNTQPAFALAATGETNQHLYQRIKRITNMKTSYINAKQQLLLAALTLTTLISLAWISPQHATDKKADQKRPASPISLSKLAFDFKPLQMTLKADTDTTKKKKASKSTIHFRDGKGQLRTYTSIDEVPDSTRRLIFKTQHMADSMAAHFKYDTKNWEAHAAKMQEQAAAMQKKFESKEWKDHIAKVQELAVAMQKKFDSPEWKDHISKMQEQAVAMQKKFDSPEWKDHIAKMQEQAIAMQKKFDSPEWKDKVAKMQEQAIAMQKKFDSPEWKDKMAKIQEQALAMQKKFDSPEWKAKIKEMETLYDSPEYQELRKKFDKDVESLKKQKGLKNEQ